MATILTSSLSENQADCPYLESLGLRHSPFTPDDETLAFLDERGGQHLNLAIHLLDSSHMIVIVLGDTGMGKSTLARQLQLRLPDTILPCLINANNLTPQSLLRSMAGQLDIPQDVDLSTQRLLLAEKTVSLRHQDCVPLIIVDDAHLLDDVTLDALIQIHTGADQEYNRWELALFSSPGLVQRVETQLTTGKENIYEIQLKPYNETQTRDYLANRMKTAGYMAEDLPFTDRQFKQLFERSNGIPARINDAAHRMLCKRNIAGVATKKSEPGKVKPVLQNRYPALKLQRILLVLAIGLITGILIFQDNINQLFEDENNTRGDSTMSPVTHTAEMGIKNERDPDIRNSQTPRATPHVTKSAPIPPKTIVTTAIHQDARVSDNVDPFVAADKTDIPKLTLPKTNNQQIAVPANKATLPKHTAPEPAPTQITASDNKNRSQPRVTVTTRPPVPPEQTRSADKLAPLATAPAQSTGPRGYSATAMAGQKWVMARDPEHYTVQLLATADEAHVQRYIKQFELQGRSYYYPIHFRSRLLYVLLTGDYADRTRGQTAMAQLPAAIRKDQPWLRALSLIQAEIKRGHK